jgi:SAM-dependent methyltransferase
MTMAAATDWWRTFFHGVMADTWLHAMPEEVTRQEVDFVEQVLQVRPPARLLDVPCGGGRHSHALAARGYHVTGVDISPRFLDAARSRTVAGPGQATWEQRDMRDLPWPGTFDGAFSMGNSFGYYDDEGNAAFLRAVAGVLKPGARFLLETGYLVEGLLPNLQERAWYPLGDILMLADRRYDAAEGRLHVEYTTIRDGKVEKWPMSARLHTYREVRALMDSAGFTDLQGYGSLAQEPFQFGSKRLLLVGTRTAV